MHFLNDLILWWTRSQPK